MVKISNLPTDTVIAGGDKIAFVDVSEGTTEQITRDELMVVDTNDIVDSAVTTAKIADGSVIGEKLGTPVAFRASRNASQSIPNTTYTTAIYDTEDYDFGGNYDNSTGVFTTPYDGVYDFDAAAGVASLNDGDLFVIGFFVNSSQLYKPWFTEIGGGGRVNGVASIQLLLSAGDTVQVQIYHNFGGVRNALDNNDYSYFSGHLVGRTD